MKLRFFGDSYDIVKKSLISWLASFGAWHIHPMFTEEVAAREAQAFAEFLGGILLSTEVLTSRTDRTKYFGSCFSARNLFLDPDTGVRLSKVTGAKSVAYVFGEELAAIIAARPSQLTLVFDQSFARGSGNSEIQRKFGFFAERDISALAYWSHAPFLLLSGDSSVLQRARAHLLRTSGLPASRFV